MSNVIKKEVFDENKSLREKVEVLETTANIIKNVAWNISGSLFSKYQQKGNCAEDKPRSIEEIINNIAITLEETLRVLREIDKKIAAKTENTANNNTVNNF